MTCSWFAGSDDPDVSGARVVPAAVAHDAGLCEAGPASRAAFAWDPENAVYLPSTVAALRRYLADLGGPQWLPSHNACWYAQVQVRVRRRHGLSVTPDDVRALEAALDACSGPPVTPSCGPYGRVLR